MIRRELESELKILIHEYPVVTILGPRQAGKTTLAKTTLDNFEYCNLELPENRERALHDPKHFLSAFNGPVILDEIQRVPELLSYIQVIVDEKKMNGQFVLTGSHQLALREAITQSLAGRTAILQLLPLSIVELEGSGYGFKSFEEYIIHGFLPRVYDQQQRPSSAYSNYFQTYVERDVRQLINLKDVSLFEKFLKLLAGRVGQLIDYSSLANDTGVEAKTIKNWLSILEASFVVVKLSPYYESFGKRVIKAPKYYFVDVGLLSYLLGLENTTQVRRDPLVGHVFENLVVLECIKARLNLGKPTNLYFYRDSAGREVDLLFQKGRQLVPVEIKSSSTFSTKWISQLHKMKEFMGFAEAYLLYSGESHRIDDLVASLNFSQAYKIFTEE